MGVEPLPALREPSVEELYKKVTGASHGSRGDAAAIAPTPAEQSYATLVDGVGTPREERDAAVWGAAVRDAWLGGGAHGGPPPPHAIHLAASPQELHEGARITYRLPSKGRTRAG